MKVNAFSFSPYVVIWSFRSGNNITVLKNSSKFKHILVTGSHFLGFPNGSADKESCNAGDTGGTSSIPGSGRSSGEGNGNPLLYSCLGNSMEEEPGRLQSKGLQRGGHNWVIKELNATKHYIYFMCTTLYLNFCPNFSPLTTKSLISITIQSTSFIHIVLPTPIPFGHHYSALCIYVFICSIYLDSTYNWASLVAQRLKRLLGM